MKIATGHELSDSVLDTVFKLFDMDGDDCLSHKEFMAVMTDRVLRGLKVSAPCWAQHPTHTQLQSEMSHIPVG